jgi:integrase
MALFRPTYTDKKTGERKKSAAWWYEFVFAGKRYRQSTKQQTKRVAARMESVHKASLAKGEVGIIERASAPTLRDFARRFEETIETQNASKPATVWFYKEKLRRLLSYAPIAERSLDDIDEQAIEGYKTARTRQVSRYGRPVTPASVNRELATLRKLLRLAHEWRVIQSVPRIRLLAGEQNREFVLTHEQERLYLATAPQPLVDVAVLILDTGLRVGEALNLTWRDVYLEPAARSSFGRIHIREGKSKYAKRTLSLTGRAQEMLAARLLATESEFAFAGERGVPILGTSLDDQHTLVRKVLKLPKDFVIHSLRHTMLTRLGESGADAFTIMRIAGHSSVTVSQRYVHPSPESLERAFERLQAHNEERLGKLRNVPQDSPKVFTSAKVKSSQVKE